MIESFSRSAVASWASPEIPFKVEFPAELMEELRAFVCDEIEQLAHSGQEAAGVLFGKRREDAIRILSWRPFTRDASRELDASVSAQDRVAMVRMLGTAELDTDLKNLTPLGWFVTHAHTGIKLAPADAALYQGFFPDPWQVTLIFERSGGRSLRAGFFARESDGKLKADASYREFSVEPLRPGPPPAPVDRAPSAASAQPPSGSGPLGLSADSASPVRPRASGPLGLNARHDAAPQSRHEAAPPAPLDSAPPAPPEAAPPPRQETAPPDKPAAAPARSRDAVRPPARLMTPAPEVQPPRMERGLSPLSVSAPANDAISVLPSFQMQEDSFGGERWLWLLPVLLVAGVIGYVVYHKTSSTAAVPSALAAPIALHLGGQGRSVEISWDRRSAAIQDADRAVIRVQDGAEASEITLTGDKLRAGPISYLRHANDVGFDMTVFTQSGTAVHEFARLVAQDSSAGAPASASESSDASQLRIQRLEYEAQIRQLKEDVRKQSSRADQLQDVIRILQNRLNVDGGRSPRSK